VGARLALLFAVYALAVAAASRLTAALPLSPAAGGRTSRAERFFLTGACAHYLLYACWWAVSWGHQFRPVGVTLVPALVSLAILVFCRAPAGGRQAAETFGLRGLVREELRDRRGRWAWLPASYGLVGALFAGGLSVAEVIAYPTWSWDCVWYHLTQSRLIVQEGTIHYWFGPADGSGPLIYANGYPRLVETFTAFHLLVLRSEALVSAGQLGWGLVGAGVVVAWGRRLGIPRPTALLLGAGFLLVPAVFLQLHTTHADVATGSQTLALAYLVFAPKVSRAVFVAAVAVAGGLVATKTSGILLVSLLLPVLVVRLLLPARSAPSRRLSWGVVIGVGLLAFAIAATRPALNYAHTKNPFYPAAVKLGPLHFPGPMTEEEIAGGKAFLRSDDAVARILLLWRKAPRDIFPDVKDRPFGETFNYFTFPAAGVGLLFALRRRKGAALGLLTTAAMALMVPASWWGRFVLPVPAVALLLTGLPIGEFARRRGFFTRPRWSVVGVLASSVLAGLLLRDLGLYARGYRMLPPLREAALRDDLSWLFHAPFIAARDREIGPGDCILFDEAVSFQGELWNASTTSRLVFARSDNLPAFLEAVTRERPKWVVVADRREVTRALELRGATVIERHAFDGTVAYRLPW
jgi:hypothetical protein